MNQKTVDLIIMLGDMIGFLAAECRNHNEDYHHVTSPELLAKAHRLITESIEHVNDEEG